MSYRIFLAGGAGVVGKRLTPMLVEAGHHVSATTRSPEKAQDLRALGAEPVIVDVFDAAALRQAVDAAQPEIVIHQLTDLPKHLDPATMAEHIARNARIRQEGTSNLVRAAIAAGARKMIAQSIAWAYAPGPEPHPESDPLDHAATGNRAITMGGVIALEDAVLLTSPLQGVVLRYGQFYGPDTGTEWPKPGPCVHVDAAAYAALLALDDHISGIFNIAEPNAQIATHRAYDVLGWNEAFRMA